MKYAMVGSRRLTQEEVDLCEGLGYEACRRGITIASGGALGADLAYLRGAVRYQNSPGVGGEGKIEIYLPWASYNSNLIETLVRGNPLATVFVYDKHNPDHAIWTQIASKTHPTWNNLGNNGKMFHARNSGIVIGERAEDIVKKIYAFPSTDRTGGTEQSFRLSMLYRVPIVNLRECVEKEMSIQEILDDPGAILSRSHYAK